MNVRTLRNSKRVELADNEIVNCFRSKDNLSARYRMKLGDIVKHKRWKWIGFMLHDFVIMPINTCSHCCSTNTFHKRVQQGGDKVDNVYRTRSTKGKQFRIYEKWDLCFECQHEFLIEMYMYQRINLLSRSGIVGVYITIKNKITKKKNGN